MKRIAISGYYGLGNVGDEAVLAGMLASFRALANDVEFTVHSANPAATTAIHGVNAVPRYSAGAVIRTIRQAGLLISGGGSLLQDVTSARSAAYYFAIIALAEFLRTPVMLYAQGVGPITRRVTALQARVLLNRVKLATVRDEGSAALLRSLGVTRPTIQVTADPSFALDPVGLEETDRIFAEAGLPEGRTLLGVAIRAWRVNENWPEAIANGITEAARRMDAVPVFLPMQHPSDVPLAEDVAARLAVESVVLRSPLGPAQAKAVVGRMGLVLGMRLHALMFAASQSVPSVAMSYDPKVTAFVKSTATDLPILDASSVSSQEIATAVERVWENRAAIQSALDVKQTAWREQAVLNSRLALDLIESGKRS
jgi:polysaccharide pyruvyl transferase CsaB